MYTHLRCSGRNRGGILMESRRSRGLNFGGVVADNHWGVAAEIMAELWPES